MHEPMRKKQQSGQALLEYALLLSVAATISLGFVSFFGNTMQKGITTFNAVLEQELATGSFAGRVESWEN